MPSRRTTYRRLLRDPRWQRRRLAIFTRDHWTCQRCGATDRALHVHHTTYRAGQAPWESPARELVTWCTDCHRHHHAPRTRLRRRTGGLGGRPAQERQRELP